MTNEDTLIQAAIEWSEKAFGSLAQEPSETSATGRLRLAIATLKAERESNQTTQSENIPCRACGFHNGEHSKYCDIAHPPNESKFHSPDYQEMTDQIKRLQIDFGSGLANNHINTYVLGEQYFQLALAALESARANMQLCCYMVRRKE
jgi:hypothetical protein